SLAMLASGRFMPSGKSRVSAIVVAVVLSLACFGAAADSLGDANERTGQLIRRTMKDKRIPGLQIAVIKDDRVVLSESYGLANVENRVSATKTTLFPLNS